MADGEKTYYDSRQSLSGEKTLSNAVFTDLTTTGHGAAAQVNSDAIVTITGSTFSGNSATATSSIGGAIYVAGGTASISGCTFTDNYAGRRGGAINARGPLTISDTVFDGNSASTNNNGGAVYVYTNATYSDSALTLTGNVAFLTASDRVYSAGPVTITGATIKAHANMGFANAAQVTDSAFIFGNNEAISIGALAFDTASEVTFAGNSKVTFAANQSFQDVAVTVDGGAYLFTGTYTIAENAGDVSGEKLNASELEFVRQTLSYANNTLTLTVESDAIKSAMFTAGKEAYVKIGDSYYAGTQYDTFADMMAATGVDAYVVDGVTFNSKTEFNKSLLIFNNITVADITGENSYSDGFYISGGSTRISNSTFRNIVMNRTSGTQYGGAMYIGNAKVDISNTTFADNKQQRGGGIAINSGGVLTLKDCTFSGNIGYAVWNLSGSTTTYTGTNKFLTASDNIYVHASSVVSFTNAAIYMAGGMGANSVETAAVTVTDSDFYFTNDAEISILKLAFTDQASSVNFNGKSVKFTYADGQSLSDATVTVDGSNYTSTGTYLIAANVSAIDINKASVVNNKYEFLTQNLAYDAETKNLNLTVTSTANAALFAAEDKNSITIDGKKYTGYNHDSWADALSATGVEAYIADGVTFTEKHGISKPLTIYNDTVFDGMVKEVHGGALGINGGTTKLYGATFSGNKVLTDASIGGAIFANLTNANNAVVEISGSTFTGNYAEKRGGALNLRGNDTTLVTISDTVFDGNSNGKVVWDGDAGAIFLNTGTLTLTGKVDFLTATDSVYTGSNATMNITDADITLGAAFSAAALNLTDSTVTFNGGTAFWVRNLQTGGENEFIFSGKSVVAFNQTDLSDINVTVDGSLYQGDTVKFASGISALGDYTIAGNDNSKLTLFLENGELTLRELTDKNAVYDNNYDGNGSALLVNTTVSGVLFADKSGVAKDKIDTSISGGKAGIIVGGAYANNTASATDAVILSIGGEVEVSGPVYGGGYMYGDGNAVPLDAQMTVGSVDITLYGGEIGNNIFGGIHAREYGKATVDEVNIAVTAGTHGRIYAGGWAEKGAVSSVAAANVTISGGSVDYLYGAGANADGETFVGTTNITIENDAVVNTIFMGGRYGYSYVDVVNLTFDDDAKVLKRLSGVSSAGMDYAETNVELKTSVTADLIDYVDNFIINEDCTLTANNEFYLGNRVEGGAEPGVTTFDFVTDGLDEAWTAIAGISDFANAKFSVNGAGLTAWDGTAAIAIGGYELTYDADKKTITLANA